MWRNALRKASWTASSASSWFRVIRWTVRKILPASTRYSRLKAAVSPRFATTSKPASFISGNRCPSERATGTFCPDLSIALFVLPVFVFRRNLALLALVAGRLSPAFPRHPLPYIGRAVHYRYPRCLTCVEKANAFDIREIHFLQIQNRRCSAFL